MKKFNDVFEKHIEKLELYVPVVERVHGGSHPEFYEVRKSFDSINKKVKERTEKPTLEDEFKKLRNVTNDYTVPEDTCESYEAVYKMLAELDEAYQE